MAEAIFLHQIREQNLEHHFEVDSAGTGDWHAGQLPDHRTLATLKAHGIAPGSRARQVTSADFENFDLIIAMDRQNARDLIAWKGSNPDKVQLMLDWHPSPPTKDVPDPYYGNQSDFEYVHDLLDVACAGLIRLRNIEISSLGD